MHIRCPHCQNAIAIVGDSDMASVVCPSCGSAFNLLPDTESYTPKARSIGHFQLLEQLGSGGFGTVWKAKDTKLDRLVAVKIPRRDELDSGSTEMFLREARAVAQLRHENIVAIHEVGRDNHTLYIVSDFIAGVSLADRLTAGPFSVREAAELMAQIAAALHHAHEAGVIHRDLKPQNIMLDMSGRPHIMDFGLAKREAGEITMTIDGKILGTPAYMPPEQARGQGHTVDRRSDIYSLGVILFQLLTHELPFRGNRAMLIHQVLHDDAPSPRKLNSRIPRDLETITLKCLQKDRNRRYATAEQVAADLRRFLASEPIAARPVGRGERLWRWCRRNPTAAALALLCVVAPSLILAISLFYNVKLEAEQQALSRAKKNADARAAETRAALIETRQRTLESHEALAQSYYDQARVLRVAPLPDRQDQALTLLQKSARLQADFAASASELTLDEAEVKSRAERFWTGHMPNLRSEAARWLLDDSVVTVSQRTFPVPAGTAFAYSPDLRRLVRCEPADKGLSISILDTLTGRLENTIRLPFDDLQGVQCRLAHVAGDELVLITAHLAKRELLVSWIEADTGKVKSSQRLGAVENTSPWAIVSGLRLVGERWIVGFCDHSRDSLAIWNARTGEHLRLDGIEEILAVSPGGTCLINLRYDYDEKEKVEDGVKIVNKVVLGQNWEARELPSGKVIWSKKENSTGRMTVPSDLVSRSPGPRPLSVLQAIGRCLLADDGQSFLHVETIRGRFSDEYDRVILEKIECPSGKVLQTVELASRPPPTDSARTASRDLTDSSQKRDQRLARSPDGSRLAVVDEGDLFVIGLPELSRQAVRTSPPAPPPDPRRTVSQFEGPERSFTFTAQGSSLGLQTQRGDTGAVTCEIEVLALSRPRWQAKSSRAEVAVRKALPLEADGDLLLVAGKTPRPKRIAADGATKWQPLVDGADDGFDSTGQVFLARIGGGLAAWNVKTGQKTWSLAELQSLGLDAARQLPAAPDAAADGPPSAPWSFTRGGTAVTVSPARRYVAVEGSLGQRVFVSAFDVATGRHLLTRLGGNAAFSPDEQTLVVWTAVPPPAGQKQWTARIGIVRLPGGEVAREFEFAGSPRLEFDQTHTRLLAYSAERAVLVDYSAGTDVAETTDLLDGPAASSVSPSDQRQLEFRRFSPGGQFVLFRARKQAIQSLLWNLAKNEVTLLPTAWRETFGEPAEFFSVDDTRLLLTGGVADGSSFGTSRRELLNLETLQPLPLPKWEPDRFGSSERPSAIMFPTGQTGLVSETAAGTPYGRIHLWDFREGSELVDLGRLSSSALAVSADARWLITSDRIYDTRTGESRQLSQKLPPFAATLVGPRLPRSPTSYYSPRLEQDAIGLWGNNWVKQRADARLVLRGVSEPGLYLVNAETGAVAVAMIPSSAKLLLSPDQTRLLSVEPQDVATVSVWDAADGKLLKEVSLFRTSRADKPRSGPVVPLELSPDGQSLALRVAGQVRFLSLAEDRITADLPRSGHVGEVDDLELSPDRQLLATCGADLTVGLWRTADGTYAGQIDGFSGRIAQLAFAGRRDRLVTLQPNGTVTLWTLTFDDVGMEPLLRDARPAWTWTRTSPVEIRAGRQVLPIGDGSQIAVADGPTVLLLDAATGQQASRVDLARAGSGGSALDLADLPGKDLLAILTSDGWVVQWDLAAKRNRASWSTRRLDLQRIAWCEDSALLAAAASSLTVWDSTRGEMFCEFGQGTQPASLAAGTGGLLVIEQEDKGLQQIPLRSLLQALDELGFGTPSSRGQTSP